MARTYNHGIIEAAGYLSVYYDDTYTAWQRPDGSYIITQDVLTTFNTVKYYKGTIPANLTADWANRAGLTYSFPFEITI